MAHQMRNLPTMTVQAECSEHQNVRLCTQCVLCGSGPETGRHLWECLVQSNQWRPAWQRLHTWLSTDVGPRVS